MLSLWKQIYTLLCVTINWKKKTENDNDDNGTTYENN